MKITHKKLNQSGVTLIETLIVMGLLSVMLIVLASIFTASADTQEQSKSYSSTISNGRLIMARLNFDIAKATSVISPSSLGSTASILELNESGTTYTYQLNGNNLQLSDGSGSDLLNGNDVIVSNPSFQEVGNSGGKPTIVYSFTITSTTKIHGIADSETFNGTAGLR